MERQYLAAERERVAMRDFHDLKVWAKAHQFVLALYKATARFPQREIYGLTSQIRRAGVSIAANIAEGCGRNSEHEFARFLEIAMGSACEVQYHLLLARDLSLLEISEYTHLEEQVTEIKRMLMSLFRKLTAEN
jgi:four helix bundle protein